MYIPISCTIALAVIFHYVLAQETKQTSCIDFKNSSTWPDSVMADLEECHLEAEDADVSENQRSSGMGERGDITTKIKGFLQKLWNRFIITMKWQKHKISILNCMWSNQKLFNIERKEMQWDSIVDLIKGLKINEVRQNKLLGALAECRANVSSSDQAPGEVIKIFKCLFTHETSKENCPFSTKTPWQRQDTRL